MAAATVSSPTLDRFPHIADLTTAWQERADRRLASRAGLHRPAAWQDAPVKVVALVSSSGGLAATQQVLSGLPANLPAAIIALQHTAPDRASWLTEILQRSTNDMLVGPAVDGDRLSSGHVYVAPPGYHTLVTPQRRFALAISGAFPPSRPSADLLLTTLAMAVERDAIAVVMSGGGQDGATGATVVHKFGGVVLATDLGTSEHFSMPGATIDRDHITDAAVPLPELAARLVELVLAPQLGER